MRKYLYGAAVQGIQSYIFQTNKLRDIVGASEQVENICTERFKKFVTEKTGHYDEKCVIIHAAGNIKYEFSCKEDCEKVVRLWPKSVVEYAPGITISQAVVEYDEGVDDYIVVVNELERRLRAQRNKPMSSTTLGLMGMHRSRTTNMPAIMIDKAGEYLDLATFNKLYHWKWSPENEIWRNRTTKKLCQKAFGISDIKESQIAFDTDKLTGKNDWIAVIHADGNGLGQVVQQIGHDREAFKTFSSNLDNATKTAAIAAYEKVKSNFDSDKMIPIRPIVLGGDDLTVICRADIALDYVTTFMAEFERQTELMGRKLTACAGIAYIKSSFPFYYGYELAEALCSVAKKDAKAFNASLAPSCLMFHKVQDSFVEDYNDIVLRELTPQKYVSLKFGPYYLQPQSNRWTISKLREETAKIASDDCNPIKSSLRQWLTLLNDNVAKAEQKRLRIIDVADSEEQKSYVREMTQAREQDGCKYYPVYDVLALNTLNTQITKTEED